MPRKRWLVPLALGAIGGLFLGEAAMAFQSQGSPQAPGSPDEVVGPPGGRSLRLVVMGDSTAVGVGAVTQDTGYPRRLAAALSARLNRRVELHVLGFSGARVKDLLDTQVEPLRRLHPDVVLLLVGGNDVTHLSRPDVLRAQLASLLDSLAATGAKVVVSGLPAMGTVTLVKQPLRLVLGLVGSWVYDPIWRGETARRGMVRVDLAALTGPAFSRDHLNLAPDGFHPSPRGYATWADALLPAIQRAAG